MIEPNNNRYRLKIILIVSTGLLLTTFLTKLIQIENSFNNTTLLTIAQATNLAVSDNTNPKTLRLMLRSSNFNLGIISMKTKRLDAPDTLTFRIKDVENNWVHQNQYNPSLFLNDQYYNFGFPVQSLSKDRQYTIELELLNNPVSKIFPASSSNILLIKYQFQKRQVFANPSTFLHFIYTKIYSLVNSFELNDYLGVLLPPLLTGILIIFQKQIWSYILRLSSKAKTINAQTIFFTISTVIALVILFYELAPILSSGYYFDDINNSQIFGNLHFYNMNIFEYVLKRSIQFASLYGRIAPGIFTSFHFYIFNSLISYKISVVFMNIICILMAGALIYHLYRSKTLTLLTILLMPLCFQFRKYHDATTSYNGLLQVIFLLLTTSLILYSRYKTSSQSKYLVLSIVFYILCQLNFYEFTYLLFPLFVAVDYQYSNSIKKSFLNCTTYIVISFIFIGQFLITGKLIKTQYSGITMNFVPSLVMQTLSKQIYAAIPTTNAISHHFRLETPTQDQIIIALLFFTVCYLCLFLQTKQQPKTLLLLGIILLIIPAIPISISARYQQELTWGEGYLPVFVQYFGVVFLFMGLYLFLVQILTKRYFIIPICFLVSLSLTHLLLLNYQHNVYIIQQVNAFWKLPMELMRSSLKNGLFDNIPANSTIYTVKSGPWVQKEFVYSNINKEFNMQTVENVPPLYNDDIKKYILNYQTLNEDTGIVMLGEIGSTSRKISSFCLDNIYLYVLQNDPRNKTISYSTCATKKQRASQVNIKEENGIIHLQQSIDFNSINIHE